MDVRRSPLNVEILKGYLSEDEKRKSDRLRILKQKQRYIIAHAFLRCLLSHYILENPAILNIIRDKYGKPELKTENDQSKVNFSLSHSDDLVAVAIHRNQKIGIDIEKIMTGKNFLGIAKRFFSTDEFMALDSLNPEEQLIAFYLCWTRKEAYLKATGRGIRLPISNFTVSITPDLPASLLKIDNTQSEVSKWNLIDIETLPDYKATVAIKGCNPTITQKQLVFRDDCFPQSFNS
jgi:4'-phosphopantetheinyl transferase